MLDYSPDLCMVLVGLAREYHHAVVVNNNNNIDMDDITASISEIGSEYTIFERSIALMARLCKQVLVCARALFVQPFACAPLWRFNFEPLRLKALLLNDFI